ncbi:UTP--glucose-1-phosphate uridylyltransferase GalU [Candidatus Gracilibacteria bacterium]|nr:UTP--glucose-1-phosphate uridylyltransferase GalU [Candidatus Gracilibacteria bacterium]
MPQRIKKAIFPAAGFGTRFLPVTKAQPKEMLPIVDKPVIQYLVEEAVAAGIEEIIIVTGRGKRAIEDHFDYSYELEKTLVEKGKRELLEQVRHIAEMARFIYVRQSQPLGDGHAILCAKEVIGNEPCAVLFGDDIVCSEKPALSQLIEVYNKTNAPVIALTQIAKEESKKYGMIKAKKSDGRLHEIEALVEKPASAKAPSNLGIIGKYIITPEVMEALEHAEKGPDGEIRLIAAFQALVGKIPLYGYEVEGKRYDTGDKFGFLQATIDFALQRPDLGPQLRAYLKTLL